MGEVTKVIWVDTDTDDEHYICKACGAFFRRKLDRCPKCGRRLLWNWWEKK